MRHGCFPFLPLLIVAATIHGTPNPLPTSAFSLETWPPTKKAWGSKSDPLSSMNKSDSMSNAAVSAYIQVRSARFGGWDDSSGIYIGLQLERFPQLYRIKAPGAIRQQVTFFLKRMTGFYPNPDPKRKNLLYTQDAGGDENFQLSLFDMTSGLSRNLGCPPGRLDGLIWNDSGSAFAYSHTPKGTDRWDIRLGRIDGKDTLMLSLSGTWNPMDFSPDGKYLLVQKYISAAEAEVYVLTLEDGVLSPLLTPGWSGFSDNAHFVRTPGTKKTDSKTASSTQSIPWAVCFTSDREGEFVRAYFAQSEKETASKHTGSWSIKALSPPALWDVEWINVNADRNILVYSINEEGISRLYSLDLHSFGSGKPTPKLLSGIPEGVIDGVHFHVSPDPSREFAFTVAGATFPGDVFTYNLSLNRAVRWTLSETGGLRPETFRAPQLVHFPTFDSTLVAAARKSNAAVMTPVQRRIPAWLYLPDSLVAHPPFPVLILIHGGPEAQARPSFDAWIQYAVGHLGLVVIQPNVRGSSGYGKSWLKADDGRLRMGAVHDIGALLAWIRTRPDLDPKRVAVAGRSYGGFMALSALLEYGQTGKGGERSLNNIRAGISTVGITHFPSFLKNTSGYRRDLRRAEYGDERDTSMAVFLDSISPLTRLDRLHSSLLLCHGRNDPRVPYQESERIFAALKSKDLPVWFLTFQDEGHGFRDEENQAVHYRVMGKFLSQELGLLPH